MKEKQTATKEIHLIGDIDESALENVLSELSGKDDNKPGKKGDTVVLWICTTGGYLRNCFGIIDLVENYKRDKNIKVMTIGIGGIASAGFFLFLLGDERVLMPSCGVFVHEHIIVVEGEQTYSVRKKAEEDEKTLNKIYVSYAGRRLGLTKREVNVLLRKSRWLTKKEIKNYGLETKWVKKTL